MFKHLLLAVDGSRSAEKAAQHGIELAKALGARVTVVTVTVPWETQFAREAAVVVPDVVVPKEDYDRNAGARAHGILSQAIELAKMDGVPCNARHVGHSRPYQAIIELAAVQGCDLIVMGSRGRGEITGLLLGSETMKVLTHSKICVLVHRGQ